MTSEKRDISSKVVLRAERLVKRFGDLSAVKELDLDIRDGEILALLGPNGAGKTVSISMLCGLLKPDSGRILFEGKPLDRSTRGIIGLCPQSIVVWPKLTCYEQLVFVGEMYNLSRQTCRQRADRLLQILHLVEKRNQTAATLSGGMQRRLNLALALVHDPQILVLDEPEAGLDPQSRVLVREYVREWANTPGRTVILTTQNMDEADRMADRVAILDRGSLLVLDTPEVIKHNQGKGDILEIGIDKNHELAPKALDQIRVIASDATIQNGSMVIRAPGAIEMLPAVIQILKSSGITPGEINLRHNTLEDVFIALTGRRLRE